MSIGLLGISIIDHVIELLQPFHPHGCNKCVSEITFGGSMRNTAENLALLKECPIFVTKVGNDAMSRSMCAHMLQQGIKLQAIECDQASPTFTSLYHDDAVWRFAAIDPAFHFHHKEELLAEAFADVTLGVTELSDPVLLSYLLTHTKTKWILNASFVNDLAEYTACFPKLYGMHFNRVEAKAWQPDEDWQALSNRLLRDGLTWVLITLGNDGLYYQDATKATALPAIPQTNRGFPIGCGDALLAGFLYSLHQAMPIDDCLNMALHAAALKYTARGVVCTNIQDILSLGGTK